MMINLSRLFEFIVILFLFTIFLFSPILTLICFILLAWFWSFSITLTIFFFYACWLYFDRHIDSHGGRWSDRLRQLSICSYFTNYFPLKLIKTTDLDPNQNYIFGFHPHGAFSFGALGNFGTDATHFSILFPNIRSHLMLLHLQFLFPFTREILLYLGACCVSKESCNYFLSGQQGQGHALVIIIGGAREMYLTKNDTMILYLKNRQGFIKLALEYGTSLVPVISFGENELYQRYKGIPWGQFIFGHIPIRRSVTTVVGKPIDVKRNNSATSEDINQLHDQYIKAVIDLFEFHKVQYGLEHVQLELR